MAKDGHFKGGWTEIGRVILLLPMEAISKTHIRYRANMSYKQTSRYLAEL